MSNEKSAVSDPLPSRWTVVLWDGSRLTVVLRWWAGVQLWCADVERDGVCEYTRSGDTADDALHAALQAAGTALSPYRTVYPEGQDPVALEREACAATLDARVAELQRLADDQSTCEVGVRATTGLLSKAVALMGAAAAIRGYMEPERG